MKIVNNFGGIDKEICNIGDILHKVGKNYSRALPIVCNENGEDFEDYRIYGSAGGVGDYVAPEYKQVHTDTVTIDGIVWDILGYDHDTVYKNNGELAQHSVTIQMHDGLSNMQFDQIESLFVFDTGLTAGTYNFVIGDNPKYSSDNGKTVEFTINNPLPNGGQLVIKSLLNNSFIGAKLSAFASAVSNVVLFETTLSEGSKGTALGTIGQSFLSDYGNNVSRAMIGNGRWSQSSLRQYLNSASLAGNVWTPQNRFDRPPSWVNSTNGFLYDKSTDFKNALGTTTKTTALNPICDGGGKETTNDKMFLLSRSEIYGGNEVTGGEGTAYDYYSAYSTLNTPGSGADSNRVKYLGANLTYWSLRTPNISYTLANRIVKDSGSVSTIDVNLAISLIPACCIPLDDIETNDWLREKFLKNPSMAFSYEVDMSVSDGTTSTITPIYLGSSSLEANEYIDYNSGKIYRISGGTLTPTNPPVPLPSIPTINGKTIVSYAGTGTAPEKAWFSGMEFEIEEVYFGDKNVFTVWAEYDGTLPAQYTANGDYLADYRVYGSAGGVGDRTVNLFDVNNIIGITDNAYINQQGVVVSDAAYYISGFIPVQPNSAYTWAFSVGTGSYHSAPTVAFYNSAKTQIATVAHNTGVRAFNFTTLQNCAYIKASVYKNSEDTAMLTSGSTTPTSYIPYGYEVDMSRKNTNLFDLAKTTSGTDYNVSGLHWHIDNQMITLTQTSNGQYPQSYMIDTDGNALQLDAGETYYAKLFTDNVPTGSNIYIHLRKKVNGTWSVHALINANGCVITVPSDVEEWQWLIVAEGNRITYPNTTIRVEVSKSPITAYTAYVNMITPIYVGSSPLEAIGEYVDCVDYNAQKIIRKIIKIEFTGEEYWRIYNGLYYIGVSNYINSIWGTTAGFSRCSHFVPTLQPGEDGEYGLGGLTPYDYSRWNGNVLFKFGTSLEDFKTYLATQKAAGTPVTVWYVCEMPIEENPPVPLPALSTVDGMTITDYAGQSVTPTKFYSKYRKQNF